MLRILFFFLLCLSSRLIGLPIGFGVNQDYLKYQEIINKDFLIYHDKRAPNEAKMVLDALNHAKPVLTKWFEIEKTKRLTIITSAATENPSFANLITNNLEIQTLGQGDRDLFWHEYVHNIMYHHYFNLLGPAGAVFHLPWMSNWWIEGIAEALSQSLGSYTQASVERMAALTDRWPTFDSLHSLYRPNSNFTVGYGISGAFVSNILRNSDPNKLGEFHKDFFHYTMPWYMLWSMVPFNGFMPMDRSLERFTTQKAKPLYSDYKKSAKAYWLKNSPAKTLMHSNFLAESPFIIPSNSLIRLINDELFYLSFYNQQLYKTKLVFNDNNWLRPEATKATHNKLPKNTLRKPIIVNDESADFIVTYTSRFRSHPLYHLMKKNSENKYESVVQRTARIEEIFFEKNSIFWLERSTENTRFCSKSLEQAESTIKCHYKTAMPRNVYFIGESNLNNERIIWLSERTQDIKGDQYQLLKFNLTSKKHQRTKIITRNSIYKIAVLNDYFWAAQTHKTHMSMRKYSTDGQCLGEIPFNEAIIDFYRIKDDLAVQLSNYYENSIYLVKNPDQKLVPCKNHGFHTSPLLIAMQSSNPLDLKSAFSKSDLWSSKIENPPLLNHNNELEFETPEPTQLENNAFNRQISEKNEASFEVVTPLGAGIKEKSTDSSYRVKHVVTSPWVSADPYGLAVGFLSLPLMELSQNEEIRAGLFMGLKSKYPDINLNLRSTRYWPTLELEATKSIAFNGQYLVTNTTTNQTSVVSSYFDQHTLELRSILNFQPYPLSLTLGYLFKDQKPYEGPKGIPQGQTHETSIILMNWFKIGYFGFNTSLLANIAPEAFNKNFIYNRLGANHTISYPFFWRSSMSLGLEYSRIRGQKMPNLKELYRPLKTFIPGEGGGMNLLHFELSDFTDVKKGRLFSAIYGHNQARAKLNWTIPLVTNFDKLVWIFYLNRLDFTSFLNYGTAWTQKFPELSELQKAHGHSLDFQFEIKGINFSLGIGTGHVMGSNYDYFFTLSFDDIFQL